MKGSIARLLLLAVALSWQHGTFLVCSGAGPPVSAADSPLRPRSVLHVFRVGAECRDRARDQLSLPHSEPRWIVGQPTVDGGRRSRPGARRVLVIRHSDDRGLCLEALLSAADSPEDQAREGAGRVLSDRESSQAASGRPVQSAQCLGPRLRDPGPGGARTARAGWFRRRVPARAIPTRADQGTGTFRNLSRGLVLLCGWLAAPLAPSASFVNAAVLVALDRARPLGINMDERILTRAIRAIGDQRKPDSSYLYSLSSPLDKAAAKAPINRPAGSLGRSQACNLALRLWGDKRITDEVVKEWLDRLITRNGWLDMGRKRPIPHESFAQVAGYFFYFGHYYGTLCIGQLPEADRVPYRISFGRIWLRLQETRRFVVRLSSVQLSQAVRNRVCAAALECCRKSAIGSCSAGIIRHRIKSSESRLEPSAVELAVDHFFEQRCQRPTPRRSSGFEGSGTSSAEYPHCLTAARRPGRGGWKPTQGRVIVGRIGNPSYGFSWDCRFRIPILGLFPVPACCLPLAGPPRCQVPKERRNLP